MTTSEDKRTILIRLPDKDYKEIAVRDPKVAKIHWLKMNLDFTDDKRLLGFYRRKEFSFAICYWAIKCEIAQRRENLWETQVDQLKDWLRSLSLLGSRTDLLGFLEKLQSAGLIEFQIKEP